MTEHINLETVEAYLASIVLPQGNILPAPMVIISDETPLYDEPGVLLEMETALAEERAAKIDGEIINIENYNATLITVSFVGAALEGIYRLNVPRPLMQVGYMYDRLLHSTACAILTESEARMNKDFASDNLAGEFLPPFVSDDIMVSLSFPKDMDKDTRIHYNHVLNNLNTDFVHELSKEEIRELAPKLRLVVEGAEARKVRGDVIEMLLGLVEGTEDALVRLYEYAEQVDAAKEVLTRNALLSEDEREAVIVFEYIAQVVGFLHPDNLVRNIEEINKALTPGETSESDENEAALEDLFSDDFQSSLDEIMTEFRQGNPDAVTLTENSTYEERVEYLTMASNLIPLMGGLVELSDRLNVDLYYSTDWNSETVAEEDYGTRGEFIIILALLAVQRMHMFAKSIDLADDEVQAMKTLALSLTTEALTQEKDLDLWFLKEALLRAAKNETDALFQFLMMALVETPKQFQPHGPFGQIMHWLGHMMVEDEHTRAEMLALFADLPILSEFVTTVYDIADEVTEDAAEYAADDSEEEDEEGEICFVTLACLNLPFLDGEPNVELAKEATKALVMFAEHCLRKDDKDIKKGTPDWEVTLSTYLHRVLTDEE